MQRKLCLFLKIQIKREHEIVPRRSRIFRDHTFFSASCINFDTFAAVRSTERLFVLSFKSSFADEIAWYICPRAVLFKISLCDTTFESENV